MELVISDFVKQNFSLILLAVVLVPIAFVLWDTLYN